MREGVIALIAVVWAIAQFTVPAVAADDALLGVWIGQSIQADGKAQTGPAANRMQFTFEKDTLKIKGNFSDDRDQTCTFATDSSKSPKTFDCILSPSEPLLGIYELQDDQLRICVRHASFTSQGRPMEFSAGQGSNQVLMVFRKRSQ